MKYCTLSHPVGPTYNGLPTEFLVFKAGVNETSKGAFVFDAKAAASVMAAYTRARVDLMIDLEHESLSGSSARPDVNDARGWCELTLRPDGSLWAVNVRWTPDGANRLSQGTQKYISPAFTLDEDGCISALLNIGLVAMPATYGAAPLVAASRYGTHTSRVVSTRVSLVMARRLEATARARGESMATFVRRVVLAANVLPKANAEAKQLFAAVAKALGLPADALPEEVNAAFMQVMQALAAAGDGSDAPPADAEPVAEGGDAPPTALSADTRALMANMDPAHRARFLAALEINQASRARVKASRDTQKQRGISGKGR